MMRGSLQRSVWLCISAAAFLVSTLGGVSQARDEELLRTLLENGAITKEQYDRLMEPDDNAAQEEPDPAAAPPEPAPQADAAPPSGETRAAAEPTPPPADWVRTRLGNRGLVVSSEDERFSMTISGRLHLEASTHTNDGDLPEDDKPTNGVEIRRARFLLAGTFYDHWAWTGEVDFADNEVAVKDFWFGFNGFPHTKLFLGHVKQPYSLSVEMSSNDIPFIERSIDNFLIIPFVDRALGLRAEFSGKNWFFATGVFGESVEPNKEDVEGWGTTGRFVFDPYRTKNFGIHLAARAAYRSPASSQPVRIRDETTHLSNLTIVDTGELEHVHNVVLVGAETAIAYGPTAVIAEFNEAYFDRGLGLSDLNFNSWRVAGTWILTGERRQDSYRMNAGEFKRITPRHNVTLDGGWGAWELATRIAGINLNDGTLRGGREKVFTLGMNWYLNPIVRFMFEWSRIVDTDNSSEVRSVAEGINIFQFRGQLAF